MAQFHAFLLCLSFGILGGAGYDGVLFLTSPVKNRKIVFCIDVFFSIVLSGGYVVFSVVWNLPPFRFYHLLGVCLGFVLYLESFHKMIAFLKRKVYNQIVQGKNSKRMQKKCLAEKSPKKK